MSGELADLEAAHCNWLGDLGEVPGFERGARREIGERIAMSATPGGARKSGVLLRRTGLIWGTITRGLTCSRNLLPSRVGAYL